MSARTILIANRGEVAIRIARAIADLDHRSVAIYSEDDAGALHVRRADRAVALSGSGPAAYLDIDQLIGVARAVGADAVHPGYGFLSENPAFARACADNGLTFIGPEAETLELFGDKVRARLFAQTQDVPVIEGIDRPVTVTEAHGFFATLGAGAAMLVKAVAGGGGRGMRIVRSADEIDEAYARCTSEARSAFGNGDVFVERLLDKVRHIEVQILGDGSGNCVHFGERDCSVQRRSQKIIELAPGPDLDSALRDRLLAASLRMATAVSCRGLATFEYLIEPDSGHYVFLEVNPRLQVEHTITEAISGHDLVQLQIRVALGESLADLGLSQDRIHFSGYALQARINMERMQADGSTLPSAGVLQQFDLPGGPGVRVDTAGYSGFRPGGRFDSLLAKLIVSAPDYATLLSRARRALGEVDTGGFVTNADFLQALLADSAMADNSFHTRYVEQHLSDLLERAKDFAPRALADAADGGTLAEAPSVATDFADEGAIAIVAPMVALIVSIDVAEGAVVRAGQRLAVLEAMKMEHPVVASTGGTLLKICAAPMDLVNADQPLFFLQPDGAAATAVEAVETVDPDHIRPDLAEAIARHEVGLDANRPDVVARRHRLGMRTIRENVRDLVDPETFVEYGALALAGQRRRRSLDDLIRNTPADGLIAGIGHVNAGLFEPQRSRCMVLGYDYSVLAGTQGMYNHKKKDRMLKANQQLGLPIILFAEGGGGRPGDVDGPEVTHLDCSTFTEFAKFSGRVPLVGVVSGRCFAGNAALLGSCDVIIATRNVSIGMAGPPLIEYGGLGRFHPDEIGPASVLSPNGVIDVLVDDDVAAVDAARRYLSYVQGPVADWQCADQRQLRHLVPENRRHAYDVRAVIATLADTDSVLELRSEFGVGIITAFIRIEGRPVGLMANNSRHLGGAIDVDAADKGARFLQLCDAYGLPILSLVDTPGFMVGPDSEAAAAVRHFARLFVNTAAIKVPLFAIVLRKGYGLGANAVTGGGFHAPAGLVSWPSGEFGPMGLEGGVKLGYRRELEAIDDPDAREALFRELVAREYEVGKAVNVASNVEIDDVIDPADSRRWFINSLSTVPADSLQPGRRGTCIDTW